MELKERLLQLRKEKGVTQSRVAFDLGITTSAYANYEQGTREPSVSTIIKLCKYFNVSTDYLLGLKDY